MPVFLILGCEVCIFSFLIGAFMSSLIVGFIIFGGSSLLMYALFQQWYGTRPLVWSVTILGLITTFLWSTYLDVWLETSFIAISLSLLSGVLCYFLNRCLLKKY